MKLSDLILGEYESGPFTAESKVALLILALILIGAFLIVMFFPVKGNDNIGLRIMFSCAGLALIFGSAQIVGFLFPTTVLSETKQNISLIKTWAENNYMVTMSTTDAKILDEGKVNYDKTPYDVRDASEAIVTYYDEKIVVTLLKVDNQWKLFNDGKELPLVEANKK